MRHRDSAVWLFFVVIGLVASSLVLSQPKGNGLDEPSYQASPDIGKASGKDGTEVSAKKRKRGSGQSDDADGHQQGMITTIETMPPKRRHGFKNVVVRIVKQAKKLVFELADQLNCLNLSATEGCVDLVVDNELLTEFGRLWLHPPSDTKSPPIYSNLDHRSYLVAMNPSLWDRLGLGNLEVITLPESLTQNSAEYYLKQAGLREVLARQNERHPSHPYVDVHLLDMAGNSFSLSELPESWLRSPELVRHISSLNLHNTAVEFDRAVSGLELVRQLFGLLAGIRQMSDSQLSDLIEQCKTRNLTLGRFRDSRGRSLADLAIEEGASGSQIKLMHASGQVVFNEQHCAVVVRNHSGRGRKGATSKRLEQLILSFRKDKKPYRLDQVETDSDNLLKAAIKNKLDDWSLHLIMYAIGGTGVVPDPEDFIETLKQELAEPTSDFVPGAVMRSLPENSLAGWKQWRDKKGNSLLDYVLATESPLYYLRHTRGLGFPAELDDLPAILQDTRRRDQLECILNDYGFILGGKVLKSWRDSDGRTLYELALFHNVPISALDVINLYTGQAPDSGRKDDFKPWHYRYIRSMLQQLAGQSARSYAFVLNQLLYNNGLQQGHTPKDGLCFYHAIASLFPVSEDALKTEMTRVIQTVLSGFELGQNLHQHNVILFGMGREGMHSALQDIGNSEWGALSWFSAVAQALYHLIPGFSGFQVITPGHDDANTPVITLFQFDGTPVEVPGIDSNIPVIFHDGINHWSFAESIPAENVQPESNNTHYDPQNSEYTFMAEEFINFQ